MIKITNIDTYGWEAAIRGMRNPMNSWEKSDSYSDGYFNDVDKTEFLCVYNVGKKDLSLMLKLAKAGSDHAKFRRMIIVTMDILAPLYWWSEYDTYKVGTVANSCSKMHKITDKEFTIEDFSTDQMTTCLYDGKAAYTSLHIVIDTLNGARKEYLKTKNKGYWWDIIQLLPASYNQLRTVQLNYEVLANIYHSRQNHKLDEWVEFCKMIETLPYSEIITLKEEK